MQGTTMDRSKLQISESNLQSYFEYIVISLNQSIKVSLITIEDISSNQNKIGRSLVNDVTPEMAYLKILMLPVPEEITHLNKK